MRERRSIPYGFPAMAHERNVVLMQTFHCSTAQIKRWRVECGVSPNMRTAPRQVVQCYQDGKVFATHKSLRSAARSVNGREANIWKCANNRVATAYGFAWKYGDANERS